MTDAGDPTQPNDTHSYGAKNGDPFSSDRVPSAFDWTASIQMEMAGGLGEENCVRFETDINAFEYSPRSLDIKISFSLLLRKPNGFNSKHRKAPDKLMIGGQHLTHQAPPISQGRVL